MIFVLAECRTDCSSHIPDSLVDNTKTETALIIFGTQVMHLGSHRPLTFTFSLCRAHSYFQQALGADPEDGETLSRYASFLWLGLGDYERAEVAYKAAIASDPTNPYFTGSYAHFLWHARDEETSCPIGGVC